MNMKVCGDMVRTLRTQRGWTQEHLAVLADTSIKTVQRVERTGVCSIETRGALASALQIDAAQLDGERPVEQSEVPHLDGMKFYRRLTSGIEVIGVFDGAMGYRMTHEDARTRDESSLISGALQTINDWAEIWSDVEVGHRVDAAFDIKALIEDLESSGLWLFGLQTVETETYAVMGDSKKFEMTIANFHVAYSDSERVIVIDTSR